MIPTDKSSLRAHFLALRQAIPPDVVRAAAEAVTSRLLSLIPPQAIVAGYAPMRGELDIFPALNALSAHGCALALPCVVANAAPLVFRKYCPGMALVTGKHGALCPAEAEDVVVPDVVLVPLLAFDGKLHRLGYGGGYYDRTLAQLKDAKAYGIAYALQRVDALPIEPYDMKLHAIITEEGMVV